MDADKVNNLITIALVLWVGVNILMKGMPNTATQLPLRVYEFFYSIMVNTEPSPSTETFEPPEPNPDS